MHTATRRISPLFLVALAACGGRATSAPAPRCNDHGISHANGTVWVCSDGCNTCGCENGQISSTLVACVTGFEAGTADAEGGSQAMAPELDGQVEAVAEAGGEATSPTSDGGPDANLCAQPPPGCARARNPATCEPGFVCDPTQGCTASDCECDPNAGWGCTADCGGGICVPAAEAGAAACPASEPQAGGPCDGPIACPYAGPCGWAFSVCSATKSYWAAGQQAACSGACPATEPNVGDACMAGGKCSYTSACGASDTVYCDGNGIVSKVDYGTCPGCPSQEPTPLTPCGSLDPPLNHPSCKYTNACGGTDLASCPALTWTVLRGDCEM
jgi:hypothetical protein